MADLTTLEEKLAEVTGLASSGTARLNWRLRRTQTPRGG